MLAPWESERSGGIVIYAASSPAQLSLNLNLGNKFYSSCIKYLEPALIVFLGLWEKLACLKALETMSNQFDSSRWKKLKVQQQRIFYPKKLARDIHSA